MQVALILPPLSQLNTPYPSISYLARHLRGRGISSSQYDLGIELFLQLFSKSGMTRFFDRLEAEANTNELPEPVWRAIAMREQHIGWVEAIIPFLQGRDRTLANRILGAQGPPSGPRSERAVLDHFGPGSSDDAARHLASLYLSDMVDLVRETIEPGLALANYNHHLAVGAITWPPIEARLRQTSMMDEWLDELTDSTLESRPDLVGISVPFPGMLYGALRIGARARKAGIPVLMGGGYISTELREVDEAGLWECVDGLIYDDGESPLWAWIEHQGGGPDRRHRTRTIDGLTPMTTTKGFTSSAWYGDLKLDHYLQIAETTNPTHRLWSDGRWNKITLAHGCYWKRCAFCDIELDYISRFEPSEIVKLVDEIEETIAETGIRGFHLVDEAAPPRLLREFSLEILRRGIQISWWGNIRFERAFTADLCRLMSAAGAVAVTGGLEVASDRLLQLMEKGVTIDQAANACQAFQDAGILVHAYLMYGFPSQTLQETVDSMEVVRQFFSEALLDSAFWHRFVLTRHSGVYANPDAYGIRFRTPENVFATNDLPHEDPVGTDFDRLDVPLRRALSAWMDGEAMSRPVHQWLPRGSPRSGEAPDRVERAIDRSPDPMKPESRLVWLGGHVLEADGGLVIHHANGEEYFASDPEVLEWAAAVIEAAKPNRPASSTKDAQSSFPGTTIQFENTWTLLRRTGLVGV